MPRPKIRYSVGSTYTGTDLAMIRKAAHLTQRERSEKAVSMKLYLRYLEAMQ